MGALHAGHVSLMHIARQRAPRVAVSIFVNPTQFGPGEDLSRYPRPIEQDLAMCRDACVDLVFNPEPSDMYPPGSPDISIDLPQFTTVLEGRHRPGHFKGVCQIVAKLFNIVQPQIACFGQKDFQQLAILQAMARALDFPITIIPCPTIRESDGLAMSSRNRYLAPDERKRALSISRALFLARDEVAKGTPPDQPPGRPDAADDPRPRAAWPRPRLPSITLPPSTPPPSSLKSTLTAPSCSPSPRESAIRV